MMPYVQMKKKTLVCSQSAFLNDVLTIDLCRHSVAEPASVLGWRCGGNAGVHAVVLPRPINGAAECHADRDFNLSQLLKCQENTDRCPAGGTPGPQRHHAEPNQHLHWWDTRSVSSR